MIEGDELIWEIFRAEVVEAAGCTETSSVGWACAMAKHMIERRKKRKAEVYKIKITLDPATYKVGSGVGIAGTKETGFYFAATLGVICGKHNKGLLALQDVDEISLEKARRFIKDEKIDVEKNDKWRSFTIKVELVSDIGSVMVLIEESHSRIVKAEIDGSPVSLRSEPKGGVSEIKNIPYRDILSEKNIFDLVQLAKKAEPSILEYVKKGVEVNLRLSEEGFPRSKIAKSIQKMIDLGICSASPLTETEIGIASAVEGRMTGSKRPAYSSGESGNQGNLASLVAYFIGKHMKVNEDVVYRSIVLSHLINAYVKCYTGTLSTMCGCSIAAGLGASAAIVYQQDSENVEAMEAAMNNVISSTGGLLCEGGNEGCAAKVVVAVDAVVRSAIAAIHGFNVYSNIVDNDAKKSIINMSKIARDGMGGVDEEVNKILEKRKSNIV